jgi:hypothetical protein
VVYDKGIFHAEYSTSSFFTRLLMFIAHRTVDVKKMAKTAGVTSLESRWLDAQALQIAALKVELDEESQKSMEEIQELKTQLQDTAEAVQAAGELLVRLKEAEESVIIAQVSCLISSLAAQRLFKPSRKMPIRLVLAYLWIVAIHSITAFVTAWGIIIS